MTLGGRWSRMEPSRSPRSLFGPDSHCFGCSICRPKNLTPRSQHSGKISLTTSQALPETSIFNIQRLGLRPSNFEIQVGLNLISWWITSIHIRWIFHSFWAIIDETKGYGTQVLCAKVRLPTRVKVYFHFLNLKNLIDRCWGPRFVSQCKMWQLTKCI